MQIINLSLGFRVGKFRDGDFLNIVYRLFFSIFNFNSNFEVVFRV